MWRNVSINKSEGWWQVLLLYNKQTNCCFVANLENYERGGKGDIKIFARSYDENWTRNLVKMSVYPVAKALIAIFVAITF